jgi:hypothetical protein
MSSPEWQAQFGYDPGTFDPEAFDIDDIHEGLRKLPKRWQSAGLTPANLAKVRSSRTQVRQRRPSS